MPLKCLQGEPDGLVGKAAALIHQNDDMFARTEQENRCRNGYERNNLCSIQ